MADETTKPHKPFKARKPKPQPTPEQLAERQAVKSWTSWKLDVQSAILACRRTGPSDARLLIYLLHQMNRKNCIAIVTDSKIADEVRGFGVDTTVYRARNRLKENGWLSFVHGGGLDATVYQVLDDNVVGIRSLLDRLAEGRSAAQERRKAARQAGTETLQLQHAAMKAERRKSKVAPLQIATQIEHENAGLSPSLTPSALQKATGRSQDVELRPAALAEAEAAWCDDCGTIVEAHGRPRCDACESDANGRPLINFARSPSREFMCGDCGAETRISAGDNAAGPFVPLCAACMKSWGFTHRNRIDPAMRPVEVMWPASRTTPETKVPIDQTPANDPGAAYRRVRDGG